MVLELVQKEDILQKESILSHITNERLLRAIENFKSESALHKDKNLFFQLRVYVRGILKRTCNYP